MQTILIYVLALLAILLALAIWSIKRHRTPSLRPSHGQPINDLIHSLAGLTHGVALGGNTVEILENGAFFDAMLAEIASATRSVHFETFLWKEGALGSRLVDALSERSRAGVTVRVLVDAIGGKKMGTRARRRLVEAGCKFDTYHPRRLRNIGVLVERDHRKIVVLDGRVAFVGGHCIVDFWLGDAQDRDHFRDVAVRVRGPIVHAMQSAFSENWVAETGELFAGEDVFPELEPAGDVLIHVARLKPEGAAPAVKILHLMAIGAARTRLNIQNPYFLPDPGAIDALCDAVARGVDVRIMVPSAAVSDMPFVQHAAHRNFERLLASGAQILEYQRTLLHQKIMSVDGVWCAIGSSNFDDRSFETNEEITLGMLCPVVTRQFEAIFERDSADCIRLELASWRQRGVVHRARDALCYLFNEVL